MENISDNAEDVDCVVRQVGMDATMTKEIVVRLVQKLNCELCTQLITATDVLPHNYYNYQSESGFSNNPSLQFNAAVVASIRYVENNLKKIAHESGLSEKLCSMLKKKYSLKFGCALHEELFTAEIIVIIVNYCITTFVNNENKRLARKSRKKDNHDESDEEENKNRRHLRRRNLNTYYSDIPILNKKRRS